MLSKFFEHLGSYFLMLKGMFTRPENGKVYWKEFMNQCIDIGFRSLPIVIIIAVFLGAVMTVQTAYQLISPIIPKYIMAQVVRDSVILELAPTIICIVLAGVVGSKIASELGNMRVSEQIDALEIMGINTKSYLVMPKIFSALIMIPCLIIIAITLSITGGFLTGILTGIMSKEQYTYGLVEGFKAFGILVAMVKAFTFAFIIASIPAYYGYNVKGGALEIGRASTTAVVVTCIMILFADYVITMLML
ncbi:MlaE family ABC transporter permease [Taibaiella chishuiensis]|uniref:Phospholipid/cholesterol/gamma-HCH transport system permease protein n=1 Tax=Taibaiella chishuiensis TaxID=1434707 RepID=A0A2P8DC97_9BACT|nr:ABC transporter permease [Taibaiella chishuiensis]PSK94843.1 phospholipid/cholesterol/gamma-HCH transport system permease protein [Taibaiella chishuiensis]